MAKKPTYKKLDHRVKELEKEVAKRKRAQQALQEAHDDLEVRVEEQTAELQSNLHHIVSPFAHKLSSKHSSLTPAEIQIARLIRAGRTTKEMAELLNVSSRTIESHRQNIRMKVGLHGKKANLRSYLLSM